MCTYTYVCICTSSTALDLYGNVKVANCLSISFMHTCLYAVLCVMKEWWVRVLCCVSVVRCSWCQKCCCALGFTAFMLGKENDVFNFNHKAIYQDMTQPMSHYYIHSSHNTWATPTIVLYTEEIITVWHRTFSDQLDWMSDHFNIWVSIQCINNMAIYGFCPLSYNLHWTCMLMLCLNTCTFHV